MTKQIIIVSLFLSMFLTVSYSGTGVYVNNPDSLPPIPILKQLEAEDPETGAKIIISNNTRVMIEKKTGVTIKGYRVKIFFDNSQSARTKAESVQAEFLEKYPQTAVYVQYSAPYFNVMAGDFINYQEALSFSHKVMKDFPKSFIVQQDIPVRTFGVKVVVPEADSMMQDSTELIIEE